MFHLLFAVVASSVQTPTQEVGTSDAVNDAFVVAYEAAKGSNDSSFFRAFPQTKAFHELAIEALEIKIKWAQCVSDKVERWKTLDEPSKTILDASFHDCASMRSWALEAYNRALSVPGISNREEIAANELARIEYTLRLDLSVDILEAKATR